MTATADRPDPASPFQAEAQESAEALDRVRGELRDAALRRLPEGTPEAAEGLDLHLDFAAAALVTGDDALLEEYAQWVGSVDEHARSGTVPTAAGFRALEEALDDVDLPPGTADRFATLLGSAADAAREARREPAGDPDPPGDEGEEPMEEAEALQEALLEGDQEAARSIVRQAVDEGHDLPTLADRLFEPAMAAVGEAWARGEATVSDEHLATATLQSLAVEAFTWTRFDEPRNRRILVACVEGNRHAMGASLLADAFEAAGWTARDLGGDVPTGALVEAAADWSPDVVALSLSMNDQVPAAARAAHGIRAVLGDDVVLLAGGRPLRRHPGLRSLLGVDGSARGVTEALHEVS